MIKTLAVAARDRGRLTEILQVASRFGLDMLMARLGIDGTRRGDATADAAPDLPRRARLALEALGPTFVKLGQILATRADLLPPEWIAELEQLHSQAATLPFAALRPAVEEALGEPPERCFASFDAEPLAAASIAQVHRATLRDGRPVVVKIRRPDIGPRIEADLRLIAHFAAVVETASAEARRFRPAALVRQLAEALLAELDFRTEGLNADRLREDFADQPRVVVPVIHWEWSSEALLVMDHVDGVAPRDAATLRDRGIDPAAIAALGADMVLDMILINGRFHADPHPGNLLCLPGNGIGLLDFGMMGHVSPRRRQEVIGFVQSFVAGDPALLADTLLLWSEGADVTRAGALRAAERLIARHGGGRLLLRAMIADFFALMREERMVMPPDLLILFKALITIDGVLSGIQSDFDLSEAMRRSSLRIAMTRLSPDHWAPVLQSLAWELGKIGSDAPRLLRAAIRRLEAEDGTAIDPAAPILSAGRWIAAAILIGSAMMAGAILLA